MGKLVVLYDIFSDSGILAGGSWALPLTNMQDPDIQRVARSTNAANASTLFTVNLGRIQAVDGIAFGPVNMSPGSTWRWRGYSDPAYSVLVYDSGVQSVFGEVIDWTDVNDWLEWEDPDFWYGLASQLDELAQYLFHVAPTAKFAQYWKLEMFDAANADGYIEIGRLMIARAFRPSKNYLDNSITPQPLTDVEESLGGLRGYWERGIRRTASYAFPSLSEAEVLGDSFRLVLRAGISRHVFVVPDPEDVITGNRRSFLATLARVPELKQLLVARGSIACDFEEVL